MGEGGCGLADNSTGARRRTSVSEAADILGISAAGDQPGDRTDLLIAELQDRVRSLEEANRDNRRIIAALTQRISALEASGNMWQYGRRQAQDRRAKIAAFQRGSTEGPLPDFVVIGAQKGGTSFFYNLLTKHPLVKPAAVKEIHFFDKEFAEGVGWYRRCFSQSARPDGQRTVTGEATPSYLFDPQVPERMAQVVPDARLIALLRNPIDRAYSHYQMQVRRGTEPRSFEEATEEEMALTEGRGNPLDKSSSYLSRGLYAEQLERFSFFAARDCMLVLKSEKFFTRHSEVFGQVLRFLELPILEPKDAHPAVAATYTPIDPATRRRLERFFAPHNERLYDLLSTDFGW